MLHWPRHGLRTFEAAIYNREVRALVKENQSHSLFGDHWADVHIQDVEARDEDEARDTVSERYPPRGRLHHRGPVPGLRIGSYRFGSFRSKT